MVVAQGGQTVLLALVREIATHATVLKITNMACPFPIIYKKLYIDIYQDSFEHLTSFAGASNNGEGRLSYRGGVACQQEYLYPGVQLVEDHLGHQHFHFLQFSLCGKAL